MGFLRIFWKNNVPEAYLPEMTISGQIVSEMDTLLLWTVCFVPGERKFLHFL